MFLVGCGTQRSLTHCKNHSVDYLLTLPNRWVYNLDMSLKYYKQEDARYGSMGRITEPQALEILKLACAKFDVPHVKFNVNPRKKRKSIYRPGACMVGVCGFVAKPLTVPLIDMAPTMMHWTTLLHEFAHHVHCVRHHRKAEALAQQMGKPFETRKERHAFSQAHVKREHGHGFGHLTIMQSLVDFFVGNGMITEKPTYMKLAEVKKFPAITSTFTGGTTVNVQMQQVA